MKWHVIFEQSAFLRIAMIPNLGRYNFQKV